MIKPSVLSKVRQVLPDCDPNATIDDVLTKLVLIEMSILKHYRSLRVVML